MSPTRCLAVMYHYVRVRSGDPAEAPGIKGLEPDEFEAQLDTLCELLRPIDWPTLVAWRAGRRRVPERVFLLTFDDGLSDHADVVLPILEKRGLRGVFFVPTGVLTDGKMAPAHQIHLLMGRLGEEGLAEDVQRWLEAESREIPVVDTEDALRMYHYETPCRAKLKYLLVQGLSLDTRNALLDDLFAEHIGDPRDFAARWYLSWDRLAWMQAAGHTIGGHGHRHDPFNRLSPAGQAADMGRCAAVLREGLGPGPRPFSYPYGVCDEDIARRCAFAGFVNGFTTEERWIGDHDDAHCLGRVDTIHVDALMEREFACTFV